MSRETSVTGGGQVERGQGAVLPLKMTPKSGKLPSAGPKEQAKPEEEVVEGEDKEKRAGRKRETKKARSCCFTRKLERKEPLAG